ncbi:hypothetical protein L484_001755 [Morus notabilis]|uniref:Late embryogenesis abundant protein LEA-2 subgroup domain-containing protein n=1 Tax=Morus notabilis TaxID=981085 RepID=W9R2T6_9ROSA|nr:hypothetical protein L484_001755 [Morus notabilis]
MADPSRPVTGYPAPPPSSYTQPNGYPYPAHPHPQHPPPPPPNYAYPYTYDSSAAATSRAAFLRRLIFAMIAFFIISASVVFIVWLVLRPRIPKFWVDSVSVSNLNTSAQTLSGDWAVGFSVYNPNKKMSIAYDQINSDIAYKKAFLSETRIAPFDQGKRNRMAINATFSAKNSYVEDWVVKGISEDRGRGTVNFHVRVWARVGFRAGGWRLRRRLLRVICDNVGVGISSSSGSGKLAGNAGLVFEFGFDLI